jgi:predicted TIM-barrel fold metal-dependent hydrolase
MSQRHIRREDLSGKTIDIHTHIGIQIREAAQISFPYCSSAEDLAYRARANSVDLMVVFPISPAFYFDLETHIRTGRLEPAAKPVSAAPYERENRLLLTDVFHFCPEHSSRFLPFVSVDPGRNVPEQIAVLRGLEREFPIYGVKILPILCQSKVIELLSTGEAFFDFFAERDWPVLLHASTDPTDEYSSATDVFRVIERHPELRYCLAHSLGFDRELLERADALPNVWVDTAALKIITELVHTDPTQPTPTMLDLDYSDYTKVMQELVTRFPNTILWGSDSPYHSYITRRLQGEGVYRDFRLKGTYEDEKAALDGLTSDQRERISNNAVALLFGSPEEQHG